MNWFDVARAQVENLPDLSAVPSSRFGSVSDVILFLVNGLLYLAGAVAVIYIIWSGFLYLTSGGDPARAEKGRNGLIYAVIGIVIISLSFVIVRVVANSLAGSSSGGGTGNNVQAPSGNGGGARLPVE